MRFATKAVKTSLVRTQIMSMGPIVIDSRGIVVLIPDGGQRYINTIYNQDWLKQNRFDIPPV